MNKDIRESEKKILREGFATSVNPLTPAKNAVKLISDMKSAVVKGGITSQGKMQILIEGSECILDSYKQGRVGRLSTTTDAYIDLIEEVAKEDESYKKIAHTFLSDKFNLMAEAQVYPSPNRIKIEEATKACIEKLEMKQGIK